MNASQFDVNGTESEEREQFEDDVDCV